MSGNLFAAGSAIPGGRNCGSAESAAQAAQCIQKIKEKLGGRVQNAAGAAARQKYIHRPAALHPDMRYLERRQHRFDLRGEQAASAPGLCIEPAPRRSELLHLYGRAASRAVMGCGPDQCTTAHGAVQTEIRDGHFLSGKNRRTQSGPRPDDFVHIERFAAFRAAV